MAFTPCAAHGKMYAGGASTFFLRLVEGSTSIGGKLQVCPDCASVWLDYLAEHFQKVSEGETFFQFGPQEACSGCGNELGTAPLAFFGNAFPRGKVTTQWYGQVCADCVEAVSADLSLTGPTVKP